MSRARPTPGTWRAGKTSDSIVTDVDDGLHASTDAALQYYGGHLIAESVAPCNRSTLIAAPAMLELLRSFARYASSTSRFVYPQGSLHALAELLAEIDAPSDMQTTPASREFIADLKGDEATRGTDAGGAAS